MEPVPENESRHLGQDEMAGLKGKSGTGWRLFRSGGRRHYDPQHKENIRQQIMGGSLIGFERHLRTIPYLAKTEYYAPFPILSAY